MKRVILSSLSTLQLIFIMTVVMSFHHSVTIAGLILYSIYRIGIESEVLMRKR